MLNSKTTRSNDQIQKVTQDRYNERDQKKTNWKIIERFILNLFSLPSLRFRLMAEEQKPQTGPDWIIEILILGSYRMENIFVERMAGHADKPIYWLKII